MTARSYVSSQTPVLWLGQARDLGVVPCLDHGWLTRLVSLRSTTCIALPSQLSLRRSGAPGTAAAGFTHR
jgi:hypothetical protein